MLTSYMLMLRSFDSYKAILGGQDNWKFEGRLGINYWESIMNSVRCEKCYCDYVKTGVYFSEMITKTCRGELF